jgi:hypothetical protein
MIVSTTRGKRVRLRVTSSARVTSPPTDVGRNVPENVAIA